MQHDYIQQKEQRCALQEDKQQFIEEIAALRSLAKLAGLTGHLLEDLDDFKHDMQRAVPTMSGHISLLHAPLEYLW